jgi:hypothetical protein
MMINFFKGIKDTTFIIIIYVAVISLSIYVLELKIERSEKLLSSINLRLQKCIPNEQE